MILAAFLIGLGAIIVVVAQVILRNVQQDQSSTGRSQHQGRPACNPFQATIKYRTRDGLKDYTFRFRQFQGGSFRIYILEPSDSRAYLHRLRDSTGDYVCWSTNINSYEDAKKIAKRWADATEEFLKTGKSF